MPLVFVHGVANRPGPEQEAEIAQRNGLFRAITFRNDDTKILNPNCRGPLSGMVREFSRPLLPRHSG